MFAINGNTEEHEGIKAKTRKKKKTLGVIAFGKFPLLATFGHALSAVLPCALAKALLTFRFGQAFMVCVCVCAAVF